MLLCPWDGANSILEMCQFSSCHRATSNDDNNNCAYMTRSADHSLVQTSSSSAWVSSLVFGLLLLLQTDVCIRFPRRRERKTWQQRPFFSCSKNPKAARGGETRIELICQEPLLTAAFFCKEPPPPRRMHFSLKEPQTFQAADSHERADMTGSRDDGHESRKCLENARRSF